MTTLLGEQCQTCGTYLTGARFNEILMRQNAALKRQVSSLEAEVARLAERQEQRAFVKAQPTMGVFYVLQLDPERFPNHIKMGWTRDPERRLATHRCAAPRAAFLSWWPCDRTHELRTIRLLTRSGCTQISREIFDVADVREFCKQFLRKRNQFRLPATLKK